MQCVVHLEAVGNFGSLFEILSMGSLKVQNLIFLEFSLISTNKEDLLGPTRFHICWMFLSMRNQTVN